MKVERGLRIVIPLADFLTYIYGSLTAKSATQSRPPKATQSTAFHANVQLTL